MTEVEHSEDISEAKETAAGDEEARPLHPKRVEFPMGGQAVLEGVMMRGPESYAVAVRRPQGDIAMISHRFLPVTKRRKWLGLPIIRGAVSLVELMLLGYKSLEYSANVAEQGHTELEKEREAAENGEAAPEGEAKDAEPTLSGWAMVGIFLVSMAFAMLLFVALPNVVTHGLGLLADGDEVGKYSEVESPILFNLVAGFFRVLVIVGYIYAISFLKDIRRLFQYHGAEHKVIMTYEKNEPLDLAHIRQSTTIHPRCGTAFIAIVLFVSIFIFAILAAVIVRVYPPFADWSAWLRKPTLIAMHILFMPLVGGIAYEFTRRAGRKPDFWFHRLLLMPGYAVQRITTREPEDDMIEVALQSFHEALEPRQAGPMSARNG